MTTIEQYRYNSQFVFDGVVFTDLQSASDMKDLKEEFVFHCSDVVIASYPKTGTTWTEEIAYSVLVGLEKSRERTLPMDEIFPFIETTFPGMSSNYEKIKASPTPRHIKTHLGAGFFQRQLDGQSPCPKFIVPLRNPKDTLVSYFYFHKMFPGLYFEDYSFSDFFTLFNEDRLYYGNGIDYSVGWWKYRDHPNVLVLSYEDMLADSNKAVRQIADFLERPLTEDESKAISEHASFGKMKERGRASYLSGADGFWDESKFKFFRKGKRGDWRDHFSQEEGRLIDQQIKEKCEPVGLTFGE